MLEAWGTMRSDGLLPSLEGKGFASPMANSLLLLFAMLLALIPKPYVALIPS